MNYKLSIICFVALLVPTSSFAKKTNFKLKEEMLRVMLRAVADAQDTTEKRTLNDEFIQAFEETLKLQGAAKYSFKNLPYVYQITSPDKRLRIFTWSVPLLDKKYFFGFAMLRKNRWDSHPQVIPLREMTQQPALTLQKKLLPNEWPGALYTKVLQQHNKASQQTYYTLLGLRLANAAFGSKIIDVATIAGDTLAFGAPIFNQRNRKQNRVVFEYNPQAVIKLEYNNTLKKIIFTSLLPPAGAPRDARQLYLPDDSYDAFVWDGDCWMFEADVKLPY
ncbi:hypothetical protein AGMMS4956_19430 [Bacteroidia bacterium]|nr:hypothetical protein AGMMS4956_19430 [Bacteroidia bacterium]